jgi:hypothetical protein
MVQLYEMEEAADGTPETRTDERKLPRQAQPLDRVFDMPIQTDLPVPTTELPTTHPAARSAIV